MHKASEHYFHPRAKVEGYVREARAIIEAEGMSILDHEHLLVKVVELLAQKQVFFEQVSPTGVLLNRGNG